MAARWSRISGGSAFVRMLETRDCIEGIRLSVRDSRKFYRVMSAMLGWIRCNNRANYLQIFNTVIGSFVISIHGL